VSPIDDWLADLFEPSRIETTLDLLLDRRRWTVGLGCGPIR
jgi:hypothetical protein